MKFDRPELVSFKPLPDGDYIGVIVGFSYVGMHPTKEWGDKAKIMLRWELHDVDSGKLCVDDEGLTHVVSQSYPATIRGESSWLYKALMAHGIVVPGGGMADSKEWYGKVALLTVEGNQGSRGDRIFMNVARDGVNPLDHDVDIKPMLKYEHWEDEDEAPPPIWARAMIDKSTDIWQRASQSKGSQSQGREQGRPTQDRPARGTEQGGYQQQQPARGEYRPPADTEEDDIPFAYMDMMSYDRRVSGCDEALFKVWKGEVIR